MDKMLGSLDGLVLGATIGTTEIEMLRDGTEVGF